MARLTTLTGPGGIGKTRLALKAIEALADDSDSAHFPDGARFVELADLNHPDMVVPRIAAVLGVSEERGRPLLDTVADALKSRRILLALDNCEHLIDACALACGRMLAASADLHILATSREPLRIAGESVWPVPPLATDSSSPNTAEAARLFTERAVAAAPAFAISHANAKKIAGICRALDGIPLAIELAAAWVRTLSVDQIAERLTDRFGLLTSGDRIGPRRQRTLRAAIDWSHDLLTVPEQVLMRRLSVFAGWSLEMAEKVCAEHPMGASPPLRPPKGGETPLSPPFPGEPGTDHRAPGLPAYQAGEDIPAGEMLDLLAALVDKSLVVRDPDALGQARYRLLDTIRQYAAGKLAAAGETAMLQRRHRDYVLTVAERNYAVGMALVPASWAERVDVFRRYDVDASNLWQALNQCLATGDLATGMRICTAVRPVWLARGEYRLGSTWLKGFLSAPGAPDVAPRVRGAALVGHAQLLVSSDTATAEPLARAGLRLSREAGDDYWTAAALNVLSEVAVHTGRMEEADSLAAQALQIAKAAGDTWGEGYSLGILAAIAGLRLDVTAARELANASIAVMRSIDHAWGAARAQASLGDVAQLQGELDDARQLYTDALPILREIDARPEIARCLVGLARVAMSLGDTGVARQHLTESIVLCRETGARIGVARGLEAFAALAIAEGDPERAVVFVAAATALRADGGLPPLSATRAERSLAPARQLGEEVVARNWARGLGLGTKAAIELAITPRQPASPQQVPAQSDPRQPASAKPASRGLVPDQVAAHPLSVREQEIATLVAAGHSNKEIAQELYISPATVARHIANIMHKLDFHTRTQIAIWTTDHLATS